MKLFIYEHITSGALAEQDLPHSLAVEGSEMLSAILNDSHDLVDLDIITLCDARLTNNTGLIKAERHHRYSVSSHQDYFRLWQHCLTEADIIFIIAPETDDTLACLQEEAFKTGKQVLGCSTEAIRLTSDKYRCEQLLKRHNIATTKSCVASDWEMHSFSSESGYIVKPIDGAGCTDTTLFDTKPELENFLSQFPPQQLPRYLIQSYVKGVPASLSLLITDQMIEVLAINRQLISQIGKQLRFDGCIVNDLDTIPMTLEQAQDLAVKVCKAINGLSGFIGIDIVITVEHAVIIEINPRLTTSYTGLRESLLLNPISRLFSMLKINQAAYLPITQRNKVHVAL